MIPAVVFGFRRSSGGSEDAQRARQILQDRRRDFAQFDWEGADVGKPMDAVAARLADSEGRRAWSDRIIRIATVLIVGVLILSIILIVLAAIL